MKKLLIILFPLFANFSQIDAQKSSLDEFALGIHFQKTDKLYWENGIGLDYTSNVLMGKRIHLKLSYATSRLGSAIKSNAIKQDNYLIGADWRLRSQKDFQLFAGLNTGFFHADMETAAFNVLPHNSILFSVETGLFYKFQFPAALNLSIGYNIINGDGVSKPGSLFPVFYQLSFFYYIGIL